MAQITSGNSVGINQQPLEGSAAIDDKPAVVKDTNLRRNAAAVFAKYLNFYLPKGKEFLTFALGIPLQTQPLNLQTFSFKVEYIGSGVVLAANIDIPLESPQSIKNIVIDAIRAKNLLDSPDVFIFYNDKMKEINLEDMDVNTFPAGDQVTLFAQIIYWSGEKKQMIVTVSQDGWALEFASEELKANKEVVLAAVRQYGFVLKYAKQELRADKEVVLAAVSQQGWALQFASDALRDDRDVVLPAVRQYGMALEFASDALRADRDVVLPAVSENGEALRHASAELRADRDVVLAAVSKYGRALQFASVELRSDKGVVLAGVSQDGWALQWAIAELRADREVVIAAVSENGQALRLASDVLRADKDVLCIARR